MVSQGLHGLKIGVLWKNGWSTWFKDKNAAGRNPGSEQTFESNEKCTLVKTFHAHHSSYRDFQDTLELAFLYAKIVTLGLTHHEKSNEVMAKK